MEPIFSQNIICYIWYVPIDIELSKILFYIGPQLKRNFEEKILKPVNHPNLDSRCAHLLHLYNSPNLSAILIFIVCLRPIWPWRLSKICFWDPSRFVYFFSRASTSICPNWFSIIGILSIGGSCINTPSLIIWIMPTGIRDER